MSGNIHPAAGVESLRDFYALVAQTREVRVRLVGAIAAGRPASQDDVAALEQALAALRAVPRSGERYLLRLDATRSIDVELDYELAELEKDLIFLRQGEEALLRHLEALHPGFADQVDAAVGALGGRHYRCLISDRDGTVSNYCGRYRSSVQAVYNAIFLTRFARRAVDVPIIVTSAPLANPGIVDVSVFPERTFVLAASKGREFIDLQGQRRSYPIEPTKKAILDRLNARLDALLAAPEREKFTLIGSGLQHKFGQTTIARQDISRSVPEDESAALLQALERLVAEIDPEGAQLRMEDTGLDVEIILTVEDTGAAKDFGKDDAVRFLDRELGLDLKRGPHLVCGDTGSDLPLLEATRAFTEETWGVFVTGKPELAERVRAITPHAHIISTPDVLVAALARVADQ